jgi:hypothetical protein
MFKRTHGRKIFCSFDETVWSLSWAFPVTAGGDSLGILCVYTKDEHQFTDEEVAFFNTLAGQAAMPFKAPIYSRRSAPATRGYGIFSSIAGRCKKRIAATLLGNSTMKLAKF